MSRRTRTVEAPGEAVGSDEKTVLLEAVFTSEPIVQWHPDEEPEGGIYLEALYWDRPDGLRVSVDWTSESWIDRILDQLYDMEAH